MLAVFRVSRNNGENAILGVIGWKLQERRTLAKNAGILRNSRHKRASTAIFHFTLRRRLVTVYEESRGKEKREKYNATGRRDKGEVELGETIKSVNLTRRCNAFCILG